MREKEIARPFHLVHQGDSLDQRPWGVLVTAPDGDARRVLNASLIRHNPQYILDQAFRPDPEARPLEAFA